jgi:calcineurin-like phosphoesterase family protein
MWPLYKNICDFLKPEDTVYFLGDAADRGDQGWEIIKAITNNSQWIYMKGNHEDMLAKAMREISEGYQGENCYLLSYNGGYNTLQDWMIDGENLSWASWLDKLPVYKKYINKDKITIHLSHAGFNPNGNQKTDYQLIWDRKHIKTKWQEDWNPKQIIVHGHTPIPTMQKDAEPGAYWYCNDHKICIDNGAFATGRTCLLDLDSFDEHIFEIPNFKNL